MSRAIDADALEKEGWSLHRTIRVDKNTEEYQTKPLRKVPTIEHRCEECEAFNKTRLLIPQPERKKGKWIDNHTTCSECGWQMIDDVIESPNMVAFNFCPHCGAEMLTEDSECQNT